MTWGEIGAIVGMEKDAIRMKVKRSGLTKEEYLQYHQRTNGERKTDVPGDAGNYKQKARQVAQRSQADVMHKHHWSYRESDYADTILMSVDDHHALHRYLVYDSNEKLYRDKSNALLRTKAAHIALLMYIKTVEQG